MKRPTLALALLLAPLAGGCVSVLPTPIVPSALIAFPAERAIGPAAPLLADVAVYVPEASRALAGADIAVRDNQELIYLADVRWSDSAPALMQAALVNSLSRAPGPGRAVPAQLGARTDYDVRWRLVDMSTGKQTAPVRVEVQVSLMESASRRMIAQRSFSAEGAPDGGAARARAAALAIAAQKVADQAAVFIAETVPAAKAATR